MTTMKRITYFSVVALFGMWGCSSNQFASRTGAGYDDLYGSSSDVQVAANTTTQRDSRYANPEYQGTNAGTTLNEGEDYYDESYITSRNARRTVSDAAGYNSGFNDGFYAGSGRFNNPMVMNRMNYGAYWPMMGPSFNVGFQLGMARHLQLGGMPFMGMSPFSNPYRFNSFGFNPWGYSGWDAFGYDPFWGSSMAMGGFYSPFGFNSVYGFNSFYNGFGGFGNPYGFGGFNSFNPYYGGFGNQVMVVNNNNDRGTVTRAYGPRTSGQVRSNETYNRDFNNTVRTSRSNGGREAYTSNPTNSRSTTTDSYYARPRANSSGTYYNGNSSSGRTSAESVGAYTNRSSRSGTYNYSSPRSSSSAYSTGNARSSSTVQSRSYNNTSRGTYNTQSNRTYESGARTSAPTFNNSSRGSVSTPSSGSSSSGSSAPSSRGPR